jgi:hypothetical protein
MFIPATKIDNHNELATTNNVLYNGYFIVTFPKHEKNVYMKWK